ncbi:heat-inducible transcriptional repressor HrcA [Novispirillum sp. DQ9]|uniref:heat-inducible transcriptional repressor HrcA n=1 Tax=Novispirillum sp. DQ9 TaxID=3398612 RepID=UPI003C7CE8E0
MRARDGKTPLISELNERSREVFRTVVDAYVETGEPIGSRTLSRRLRSSLSPATIRNVMADLEDAGLLYAPHTSAGRLPTEMGLRLFVSGLLEIGDLTKEEREQIDVRCRAQGRSLQDVLGEASAMLSGLSRGAGLVLAPKTESALKHIEFVNLGPGRALVVMVTESGVVENRLIEVPAGLPPSALTEASNFLSARLNGQTIDETRQDILADLQSKRAQLDALASKVVEAGLATWTGGKGDGSLIVRGQANLLNDVHALEDLERIRTLFSALETREQMLRLLELVGTAEGVQIFIGSENELFGTAGCSMIVAPYQNSRQEIVGAIGVIGPTRINYARIIPLVDYTAKVVGRLIG